MDEPNGTESRLLARLQAITGCQPEVVQRHDDGDITARACGDSYVLTTDERIFKELVDTVVDGALVHIMEHEAVGAARMVNPTKAKDPGIPCRCFEYEGDTFCWKKGYLGLISSKSNPEQMADCVVKVPVADGVAERYRTVKKAIGEAHQEWRAKGGGLPEWWEKAGEKLAEHGVG